MRFIFRLVSLFSDEENWKEDLNCDYMFVDKLNRGEKKCVYLIFCTFNEVQIQSSKRDEGAESSSKKAKNKRDWSVGGSYRFGYSFRKPCRIPFLGKLDKALFTCVFLHACTLIHSHPGILRATPQIPSAFRIWIDIHFAITAKSFWYILSFNFPTMTNRALDRLSTRHREQS